MNAITITTPDQLVSMIIGVAIFFIVGFALSYLHYRLTEKNQAN